MREPQTLRGLGSARCAERCTAGAGGDSGKPTGGNTGRAPRVASLLYPRLSREEFEGRFLGLMPYLELKGEGNRSMAGN